MLLLIIIGFFLILFISNLFFSVKEGFEDTTTSTTSTATANPTYKPYDLSNNSLILSQQNAGNIEVLKGRIDDLDGIKKKVDDMQQSMDSMQTQLDGLVQQQAEYATELAGTSTPMEVNGLDEEEEEPEDIVENN